MAPAGKHRCESTLGFDRNRGSLRINLLHEMKLTWGPMQLKVARTNGVSLPGISSSGRSKEVTGSRALKFLPAITMRRRRADQLAKISKLELDLSLLCC